jgi:hypothetical protein
VTIENQTASASRPRQSSNDVKPVGQEAHFPRLETFVFQPIVDIFGDAGLGWTRAIDVANSERQIDQLVSIDEIRGVIS